MTTTDEHYAMLKAYADAHHRSVGSLALEATDEFLRRKAADKERAERRRGAKTDDSSTEG